MSHNLSSGHITPSGTTCVRSQAVNNGLYFVPRRFEVFTTHAGDIALTVVVASKTRGIEETVLHLNLSPDDALRVRDILSTLLEDRP